MYGIIGKKLGMTRLFTEDGSEHAVTLLEVEKHEVISSKEIDKHGYEAVVVGTIPAKESKLTKAMKGFFEKLSVSPYKMIREFRTEQKEKLEKGAIYGAEIFSKGDYVDATGISIGKGFAGAMKRHHFGGLRASHGVSVTHRSHGSTGNRTDPGKVFKNKKMAGHLGATRVTMQNLKVFSVEENLLAIEGSVPGHEGSYVMIQSAVKRKK